MYKHNITVNIIANTIKKIANGIVHPPKAYETNDVAKAKMANTNKRIMAITNEIIGIYLGKQWVKAILIRPAPIAMIKAYQKVFANPLLSNAFVLDGFWENLILSA